MGVTPSGLKDIPQLQGDDQFYRAGFFALSRSRQQGMNGALAITITEIEAYLRLTGEGNVEERIRFLRLTQMQDMKFLEHVAKQSGSKT